MSGLKDRRGVSPLALAQELVARDLHYPWRVLVCCIMLNRTAGDQARPYLDWLLGQHAHPESLAVTFRVRHLLGDGPMPGLRRLGLPARRTELLWQMTEDYLLGASPYDCFGVGQYARDALDLFCAGQVPDRPMADKWLEPYRKWRAWPYARGLAVTWDEVGYVRWLASINDNS